MALGQLHDLQRVFGGESHGLVDEGGHPLAQPGPGQVQVVAAVAVAVGHEDEVHVVADLLRAVADAGTLMEDRGQTLGRVAVLVHTLARVKPSTRSTVIWAGLA